METVNQHGVMCMEMSVLLTVKEAAEVLRARPEVLRGLVHHGVIQARKVWGKWVFRRDDLIAFVENLLPISEQRVKVDSSVSRFPQVTDIERITMLVRLGAIDPFS